MQEKFYRGEELGSEIRTLPAVTYNTFRLLLDFSPSHSVFVPIRSMQYMAVIDREEIIFLDGLSAKRSIEFSWQKFKPQVRDNLTDPVPYRFVYYNVKALETIKRLQWEFDKCLHQQHDRLKREQQPDDAKIITLDASKRPSKG